MQNLNASSDSDLDWRQPLKLRSDQRSDWHSFGNGGLTFDEAAQKILDADREDGRRFDIGAAKLGSWAFGPAPDGTAALATLPAPGREQRLLPLRAHAFRQLCARVGAPAPYIEKLPAKLAMVCLNHGMQQVDDDRGNLLRLAGGEVRAVLSDRYAPLDNEVVLDTLRSTLRAAGMLGDVRVRSIAHGPTAQMRMTLPGSDIVVENPSRVGDVVEVGLDLLNGEVGNRSISISPVTWRLVCLNGMRSADRSSQQRLRHVGDPERLVEAFRDAVPSALAEAQGMGKRMQEAVDVVVDDLLAEFDGLRVFGLGKGDARDVAADVLAERSLALPTAASDWKEAFEQAGDITAYDVLNGITHVAQTRSVERRLEMEEAASAYLRRRTR